MKNRFKKNEKGFALPLALLLLVVMTIMGATLVNITSVEHVANTNKDSNQQTFYAAESGIAVAKKYMVDYTSLITGSSQRNLNNDLKFCKASFFPNLRNSNGFTLQSESLNDVISASDKKETERLEKFSFEYFIAYSPDADGNNNFTKANAKKNSANRILYTIYSCGCNETKEKCSSQSNLIVPLEAVVTIVQ